MRKYLFNLRSDREYSYEPEHKEQLPAINRQTVRSFGEKLEARFSHEELLSLGLGAAGAATILATKVIDVVASNEAVTDKVALGGAAGVAVGGLVYALDRITRP